MQKFTFHEDPGHGWLEVPKAVLDSVMSKRQQSKISGFSREDAKNVYLEEDCDAGCFIDAFKDKYAYLPSFDCKYSENIFIRNLGRFQPPTVIAL